MRELIEALVFAPIGFVAGPSRSLSDAVAQGRTQVANARLLGEMATRMGSAKVTEQAVGAAGQLHSVLVQAGLLPPDTPTAVPEQPSRTEQTGSTAPASAKDLTSAGSVESLDAPAASELAIVDYDSLAASQVVPRLVALKPEELEAVRRYELAHRGRKTILGRVAQIQR